MAASPNSLQGVGKKEMTHVGQMQNFRVGSSNHILNSMGRGGPQGGAPVGVALVHSGLLGAPRLRNSLRAVHASELGTRVSPPPSWSCAVNTSGMAAASRKRAQGPALGPGDRT